jgi:acetoin utilization deacetylase AcuC-like enzyme
MFTLIDRTREIFNPDYVVVQCGADGLAGDPYAVLNWSLGGEGSMGWYIEKIIAWPGRKLLLGGGGYNSPNVARTWAYLTSIAVGPCIYTLRGNVAKLWTDPLCSWKPPWAWRRLYPTIPRSRSTHHRSR